MTSVRKWHTRIRVASTKERRLSKVLFEINAICSVLCLPKTMAETEALLYRNFENKNEAKGKSITSMAVLQLSPPIPLHSLLTREQLVWRRGLVYLT